MSAESTQSAPQPSQTRSEQWFKIVRDNGKPIFPYSGGIVYEPGRVVELSGKEFKNDSNCGYGLHYGTLESCVVKGLGVIVYSHAKKIPFALVPWRIDFKVLEVNPLGERIQLEPDKFKTNKLSVLREVPAEEYLTMMLTSQRPQVREIGAVQLAKQTPELREALRSHLLRDDENIAWLERWDFLHPELARFVGVKVRTTHHFDKSMPDSLPVRGSITALNPNTLVASVDGARFINIYWLTPAA